MILQVLFNLRMILSTGNFIPVWLKKPSGYELKPLIHIRCLLQERNWTSMNLEYASVCVQFQPQI
jgi:hypothetical protein